MAWLCGLNGSTVGGRGGTVHIVTSAAQLITALELDEPRVVIIDSAVAAKLEISKILTAPDNLTLHGNGKIIADGTVTFSGDSIIRNTAFRSGPRAGSEDNNDCVRINGDNCYFLHCDFRYSQDELVTVSANHITFRYCIFTEPLGFGHSEPNHKYCLWNDALIDDILVDKCIIANGAVRTPVIRSGNWVFRDCIWNNNLLMFHTGFDGIFRTDWVQCHWVGGPDSIQGAFTYVYRGNPGQSNGNYAFSRIYFDANESTYYGEYNRWYVPNEMTEVGEAGGAPPGTTVNILAATPHQEYTVDILSNANVISNVSTYAGPYIKDTATQRTLDEFVVLDGSTGEQIDTQEEFDAIEPDW